MKVTNPEGDPSAALPDVQILFRVRLWCSELCALVIAQSSGVPTRQVTIGVAPSHVAKSKMSDRCYVCNTVKSG